MNIDWLKIIESIEKYCVHVFTECNLPISKEDVSEGIAIFKNVIEYPMEGCLGLRGLETKVPEALMKTCVNKDEENGGLEQLKTGLEAFSKKILILSNQKTYTDFSNSTTLWPLFSKPDLLNLCPNLTAAGKRYSNINIEDYKQDQEGVYILSKAANLRNDEGHNCQDLDLAQFYEGLKYCIACYIFITIQWSERLKQNHTELAINRFEIGSTELEEQYLYEFVSFGNTATNIKNQIVESFIINKIHKASTIEEGQLFAEIKAFTKNSLDENSIKRFLNRLKSSKRVECSKGNPIQYKLSYDEHEKFERLTTLYNNSLHKIKIDIQHAIEELSIECDFEKVFKGLTEFLLDSFYKNIYPANILESDDNISKLIKSFQDYNFSVEQTKYILRKVVEFSSTNNILYKLSLGRAFSKLLLTNSNNFENFCRIKNRNVYLDTQIVLYILCLKYECKNVDIKNINIAKQLVELIRNRKIPCFFPEIYLKEVEIHFKRALGLLQITRNKRVDGMHISNNVFYVFYCFLKENSCLETDINSFSDFMSNVFELQEEDLEDEYFNEICKGVVESSLRDNGISFCGQNQIPFYESEDLAPVQKIFEDVISKFNLKKKDFGVLKSDSIIGKFLFHNDFENEPFFLSMDNSFKPFKSEYFKRYKRGASSCWYLYTPAQFINHVDLVNLTIDEDNLSNEMLSYVNTEEQQYHTVIDGFMRLVDVKGVTIEQQTRNRRKIFREFIGNEEFGPENETILKDTPAELIEFCELCDETASKYSTDEDAHEAYISLFKDDDKFDEFVKIIRKYTKINQSLRDLEQMYAEIEKIIFNW